MTSLKQKYQKAIKEESNIRIRERIEETAKWITDTLFGVVFGGLLVLYITLAEGGHIVIVVLIGSTSVLALLIGTFLATKYVRDYHDTTNKYIKQQKRQNKD